MKSQDSSFCFLIPSRKRTKLLEQTISKIVEKTYDLTKIEIILGVDSDDLDTQKFPFSKLGENKVDIKKVIIERKSGYEDQPRRLLEMIKASKNDFFIHFADDMEIETKNWDKIVRDKIRNLPDDMIYLIYPAHNQLNKEWPLCQIISREWFLTTKKFTNFFETDTELLLISGLLKRKFIIDNFIISHIHHNNKVDDTFLEGRGKILIQKYNKKSVLSLTSLYTIFKDYEKLHNKINSKVLTNILVNLKILFLFFPRIIFIYKNFKINYMKIFLKNLLLFKI